MAYKYTLNNKKKRREKNLSVFFIKLIGQHFESLSVVASSSFGCGPWGSSVVAQDCS
jgi:hypothetical protein